MLALFLVSFTGVFGLIAIWLFISECFSAPEKPFIEKLADQQREWEAMEAERRKSKLRSPILRARYNLD